MTTHATVSFEDHKPIYGNRIYARTKTITTTTRQIPALNYRPVPNHYPRLLAPIDTCENLLYDVAVSGDVGSSTSSSYINSSEHYDNTYTNTYDNPIQYFENYPSKLLEANETAYPELEHSEENFYDHARIDDEPEKRSPPLSRSTSPSSFYTENRNLAIGAFFISVIILLVLGIGIFLLNRLLLPVIINTTVNNHYGFQNVTNITDTSSSSSSSNGSSTTVKINVSTPLMILKQGSKNIFLTTRRTSSVKQTSPMLCPSNRWGTFCEYTCKPCGLGVCHPSNGQCICPPDIYGEFCDLWKINDKPKRGDMTK